MQCIDESTMRTSIRNIYIFPTRAGWLFLLALAVMWLFGVNYDNNLVLLTALFGGSAFISALFITWSNLRGIIIFPEATTREVKAGTGVPVSFTIDTANRKVYGVKIWSSCSEATTPVDLAPGARLSVICQDEGRGIFRFPRFKVYADYPLGLMRASFYVEAKEVVTVWPKTTSCEFLPQKDLRDVLNLRPKDQAVPSASLGRGSDEIYGLRQYREGDPLNLVDWKQLARGRGLMVREFSPDTATSVVLTENSVRAHDYEDKISKLAYAVDTLAASGVRFGLEFAGLNILPSSGESQRVRMQKALALLPKEER